MIKTLFSRKNISLGMIYAYMLAICIFILAPIVIVAVVSFQHGRYLAFPIDEFSLRWWTEALVRAEWRDALWKSLLLALQSTILSTLIGLLAGLAIHNHQFKGKQLLSIFFLSPLLMPQLLTGLALLFFFAELGFSSQYMSLLLGHVLIAFPFVVRLVLAALPNVSQSSEEAARTLGANEFITLFTVTLPQISPAIRGGAMFAFMASYNNVLISLFMSTPRMVPMPIKILQHLEFVADPTIAAVSTMFLIVTFIVMFVLEKTVKLEIMPGIRTGG